MKILFCFGTRPEAIKMAPLIIEMQKQKIPFKVCVTAQHRSMLDQVLNYFEIFSDYDLDLMKPDQSLNNLSGKLLMDLDPILKDEEPTLVLVQGDTTSAAISAQAAFNRGIKVGHIEAGLRTYNKTSPFPEEINRQIISRIADLHFAPTEMAQNNLVKELIPAEKIFVTGNTVVDSLHWALKKSRVSPITDEIAGLNSILDFNKKIILVTGHRRETFGTGLKEICLALIEIAKSMDVEIVFPVHLNPNIKDPVHHLLNNHENVHLIKPLSYPDLIWLMQKIDLIISDSGGIQEEAPTFKKPLLITREVSERMEGVNAGFATLVGSNKNLIVKKAFQILNNPPNFQNLLNPYGDGCAAKRIVKIILDKES